MINTNFNNNKIPKENTPYKCLSLIMLECVIRTERDYCYPQTLLEECKYEVKIRNKCIDFDFDKSSSDQSDSDPDSETDGESEKPSNKSDNN